MRAIAFFPTVILQLSTEKADTDGECAYENCWKTNYPSGSWFP